MEGVVFQKAAKEAVRMEVAEGSQDTSIDDLNDFLMNASSGEIAQEIWVNNLEGRLRTYVEPVTAKNQCKYAKVKCNNEGKVSCWICNCPIIEPRKAQCEHLLPVIRAIMFTGIITTARVTARLDEAEQDIEELQGVMHSQREELAKQNLLCADDLCNGFRGKSGTVLIKFSDDGLLTCVPDEDKIEELVNKIIALRKNNWLSNPCYDNSADMKKRITEVYSSICVEINKELSAFVELAELNNCEQVRNAFCQYAMSKIQLYASEKALALLPKEETEEERIAREEVEEKRKRVTESFERYSNALATVVYQMYSKEDVDKTDKLDIEKMVTSDRSNYREVFVVEWWDRRVEYVKNTLKQYLTKYPRITTGLAASIVQALMLLFRLNSIPHTIRPVSKRNELVAPLKKSFNLILFGIICKIRELFYPDSSQLDHYFKKLLSTRPYLDLLTVIRRELNSDFIDKVMLKDLREGYLKSIHVDASELFSPESKTVVETESSIKAQISPDTYVERYGLLDDLHDSDGSSLGEDLSMEVVEEEEEKGGSKRRTKKNKSKTKAKKRKTHRIKRRKNNRTRKH
jgi:hypothetical protein